MKALRRWLRDRARWCEYSFEFLAAALDPDAPPPWSPEFRARMDDELKQARAREAAARARFEEVKRRVTWN